MRRPGQYTLFFSWLKEVASVAVATVSAWAGQHGGIPKCVSVTWEVWVKGFNRMNSSGNAEHTDNMSGTSVFSSSIFVPFLSCMEIYGCVCYLPFPAPLLNESY